MCVFGNEISNNITNIQIENEEQNHFPNILKNLKL